MADRCPECNSLFLTDPDASDHVRCKRCGAVSQLEEAMDHDPYG